MDFYFGKVSGNSTRAAFGLFEAGCEFTPHILDYKAGENRAPAYLAINPMGKIPSLVDGAFKLWESNAINWYAAEKRPSARLLPDSVQGRADVQRWLMFQAAHVTPACIPIMRATHPGLQEWFQVRGDRAAAESSRKELVRYLHTLDEALEGREWLVGAFSLADIAYAPHLYLVREGGFDFGPWPSLRGWLDRLTARPSWREAHALVLEPL
jgi:glutathione S-transferase